MTTKNKEDQPAAKPRAKKPRAKKPRAKKPVAKKPRSLAGAHKVIAKVFKNKMVGMDIDPASLKKTRPFLTTNSIVLDYLIGGRPNRYGVPPCPGWPKGRISNIYGHESSGKTTIALEAAAAVCAAGGLVVFIDWEHAIAPEYAAALGCPVEDTDKFCILQPNTLEEGIQALWVYAEFGCDLIILDSVGAGTPNDIASQSLEEKGNLGRLGLVAAKWSRVLPLIAGLVSRSGTHIMGLSQLRKKINTRSMGGPDTTHQGGEAWKFFSSVRIRFKRIGGVKGKAYDAVQHKMVERFLTNKVQAKIEKSKVSGSQQQEAVFHITFGEGIDNLLDCIMIGKNHGIVVASGSWFSWERADGTIIKGQGLPKFMSLIKETPRGGAELEGQVRAAMTQGGLSTTPVVEEEEDMDFGFLS